jgi:hypothetical protein
MHSSSPALLRPPAVAVTILGPFDEPKDAFADGLDASANGQHDPVTVLWPAARLPSA